MASTEQAAATSSRAEPEVSSGVEDRGTKTRKLATFLIMLGPELSSEILKQFDEVDIVEISGAMAKIEIVDYMTQNQLMGEFSQIAFDAAVSLSGGARFTQQVLEKSIGPFRANELVQRVAPKRQTSINTEMLREFEAQSLFNLLKGEDPQTIAFVLSYVDSSKCAETLALLRSDIREEVVERIANMEPTSTDVVGEVLDVLKRHIGTQRVQSNRSGGVQSIAEVIKRMESSLSKSLLGALDEKNPELSKSIKKILFTFEDLKRLDPLALQKILREVESKDLAIALKTASEGLQQAIFKALPKRAAENIREEIKMMGPVRLKDIETAQEQIIEAMRKLESQGEIIVGTGGKSDVMV